MKKQSLLTLLSLLLSACSSSQRPAPIEYNNGHSNKAWTKTNPKVIEEGEIISTGAVIVEEAEIISPTTTTTTTSDNDNIIHHNDDNMSKQNTMTVRTKVIYHEVQVGETIEEISAKYGITVAEIAALNDLVSPYYLEEFQVLKIKQIGSKDVNTEPNSEDTVLPDSNRHTQTTPKPSELKKSTGSVRDKSQNQIGKPAPAEKTTKGASTTEREVREFIMPVKGKILAKFGDKADSGTSKGISIGAKKGAEVRAAASGKIIYADYDATYGNLIIIKLNDKNIFTSYAHLDDITKHKGADIRQGELIGHVGTSGKVKEPQLNFGIREGKIAKDPAKFLKY